MGLPRHLSEHISPTHLARAQGGAISRAQLRGCGLSEAAISRQIQAGRLHPKSPGVYAVGHPTSTREGRWRAALLAAGPGSRPRGREPPRRPGDSGRDRAPLEGASRADRGPGYKLEFPDDPAMQVSHETIYQSLFVQARGALERT